MQRVDEKEAELRLFWRISKEAREAARTSADEADIRELVEELDSFGRHVDWPMLRNRCLAAAADLAPPGPTVVRA